MENDSTPPLPPEDGSFFSSKEWAAIYERRLRDYGAVVRELYGANGKIRKFCENNRSDAIAYVRKLPPYFRRHFRLINELEWWPSDFLRVAGSTAWKYKPFRDAVSHVHDAALRQGRGNESPVLLPGLARRSRLVIAEDARSWDEFKRLSDAIQDAQLGTSRFPMVDDGGNYDEEFYEVSLQAQEELRRFLKVESDLLREARQRPYAKIRHLKNYRFFERLREEGKTWIEAEEQLAAQQGLKRSAIHGDIQRARHDLALSMDDLDDAPPHHRETAASSEISADSANLCPDHGKPMDALLTCSDCRSEATADFPSD